MRTIENSDVPYLCSKPFESCLTFEALVRNGDPVSPDLLEFMAKAHYGTASLTHFASYGKLHYYLSEEYPDYLWKQDMADGYPKPMTVNLRANMTDRFWEIVIQHTAAHDDQVREEAAQREAAKILKPRR